LKIYRIGMYENPTTDRVMAMKSIDYAHFSVVGTWSSAREPCNACGWHWQEIVPPLLVQWEPSTQLTGDFSWDGPFGYTFAVKDHVAEALSPKNFECRFLPVDYVKPTRQRNTVPFPYKGPRLLWGECSATVELDMKATGVELLSSCSECGDRRYTFRSDGIVVRRRNWNGQPMFRIATNGRSEATFVTDMGRQILENARFSNIAFSEAGQIID
jgi:hypothetical protein